MLETQKPNAYPRNQFFEMILGVDQKEMVPLELALNDSFELYKFRVLLIINS